MRRLLTLLSLVLVLAVTSLYGILGRVESESYEEIERSKINAIWLPDDFVQEIAGLANWYNVYQDIKVETLSDLEEVSEYIFVVKVSTKEQWDNTIYTLAEITKVLKDESGLHKPKDSISFMQMNYISKYDERYLLFIMSPIMTTKYNEEYVVFLNRIPEYRDIFRTATICSSIIPLKKQIEVIRVTVEAVDYIGRVKNGIFDYYQLKNCDFLWLEYQGWNKYLDDFLNPEEAELMKKANAIMSRYFEIYEEITEAVYRNLGSEPVFNVIDYMVD